MSSVLPAYDQPQLHDSLRRVLPAALGWALAVVLLLVQLCSRNHIGSFSNWFVPDGITLATTFREYWAGTLLGQDIAWGVPINYAYLPAVWLGVLGFVAINIGLIVLAQRISRLPMLPAMLLLPYFLMTVALPSKDILMLAASYAVVHLALERRMLAAWIVTLVAFTIRDGALPIFGGFLLLWTAYRRMPRTLPLLLFALIASATLLDLVAQQLFGDLFIFARNRSVFLSVADQTRLDLFSRWGVPLRVFANLTNMAMRPSIFDREGGIALIGIAYFVSGIGLLYASYAAAVAIWRRLDELQLAAALMFAVSLAVMAVSPLIQPRYLLPAAAMVISVTAARRPGVSLGLLASATALSVAGILAYLLTQVGLPLPAEIEPWSPW